jgi:sigma54-dependent transcription regulator
MSYIKGILKEEYDRLDALTEKYRDKVSEFPKGSVSVKNRNNLEYLYLAFRKGSKIFFQYIGPLSSDNAQIVLKQIEQRKKYEEKLKQVKKDLREIAKAVNGRKL